MFLQPSSDFWYATMMDPRGRTTAPMTAQSKGVMQRSFKQLKLNFHWSAKTEQLFSILMVMLFRYPLWEACRPSCTGIV